MRIVHTFQSGYRRMSEPVEGLCFWKDVWESGDYIDNMFPFGNSEMFRDFPLRSLDHILYASLFDEYSHELVFRYQDNTKIHFSLDWLKLGLSEEEKLEYLSFLDIEPEKVEDGIVIPAKGCFDYNKIPYSEGIRLEEGIVKENKSTVRKYSQVLCNKIFIRAF